MPFAYVGSEFDCGSHEGHSGWTIEQLAEITEASMSAHRPDVALFMAGTNDFFNAPPVGANATGAAARLRRLLDTAFRVLPKLTFLISTVTTIDATRCKDYPKAPWHPPPCPAAMQGWRPSSTPIASPSCCGIAACRSDGSRRCRCRASS